MAERLDELYFRWLYSQVSSVRIKNPVRTYWSLLRKLHEKNFVWLIQNDDNRESDGLGLRYEYADQQDETLPGDWMDLECSMLEMLIGLSRRLAFEDEGEPREWFWILMRNLELDDVSDYVFDEYFEDLIQTRMDAVIWRNYAPNGHGGLFPLEDPDRDQRKVELWYQLNAFLLERS